MQSKKRIPLKLIRVPESTSSETVAENAKKLLDKFEPAIQWDIVNANKVACVLQIGNRYGLYSSIDMFIAAIENVGKFPGISMTDIEKFEVNGFKYVGRGFTIKDPALFFPNLLGKIKAKCEIEIRNAEAEFSQAEASEKEAAKKDLMEAYAEFGAIEAMENKLKQARLR